jgi:1-acyl-sn-glycerol-3-phosphate acyltransferase
MSRPESADNESVPPPSVGTVEPSVPGTEATAAQPPATMIVARTQNRISGRTISRIAVYDGAAMLSTPTPDLPAAATSYLPVLKALWHTARISAVCVVRSLIGRFSIEQGDRLLRQWSGLLVDAAGVHVTVEGAHHFDEVPACVLMSNHQSHYDVPIIFTIFPKTLRMIAKEELFRVPLWGRAMRDSGFIAVDRSGDREKALAAISRAAGAVERGISIWLAPEGTRSLDGTLGSFKKGGFHLALETGAPIVPLVLEGSRHILPKHGVRVRPGVEVRVTVGAPIQVRGRDMKDLMAEVRAFMTSHLPPTGE